MSSETLSQSEIDLLFNSGDAPAADVAARPHAVDVQVYDFSRPSLMSKERKRALDAMYGVLAKSVEVWLAGRLRGQVEVMLMGVDQLSYGEFVLSLPTPCSSFVYDVKDASVQAVIDFGQEFAYFLVERLLGANGAPLVQDRSLTPLERMLVRIAADKVAEQLDEVWQDHAPLGLSMSRFESVPDMIQAAGRQDPVIVGNLMVRASGIESTLMMCLPFSVVEKFFSGAGPDRLTSTRQVNGPEQSRDRTLVQQHVRTANVQVAVRTPTCTVTMADLRRIRPGATLQTGLAAEATSIVFVEDRPRFTASIGRAERSLAARILDTWDPALTGATVLNAKVMEDMTNGIAATTEAPATADRLDHLLELTLPLTIELGRTRMTVQEVLELSRGSIVQLDRLVGEPVDILVGERRFAEGEVVVLGEQFGVRITRILHTGNTAG